MSADEDEQVAFPLLSDKDLTTCKAYGVFDREHDICLPAVVLVHGAVGNVRWVRVSETIGDRPTPDEILEQVRRLGG